MGTEQQGTSGSARTLELQGAVGVARAAELCAQVRQLAAAQVDVVADLSQAEHLDGSILQLLVALGQDLRGHGRSLRLQAVPPAVEAFIRTAGLGEILLWSTP